ncbi:hypothetical protein N7494_013201 [Penicillium frequentans]|uniref:Uncharacterized protein n=1 Tax=Penicillium frequentans TaxID=3151616 RepID=A0AAD6G9L8_9EURO|nr:hypothetical protein N7494_013201 [Penicillium glabrum]
MAIVFTVGLQAVVITLYYFFSPTTDLPQANYLARRWGGFSQRPSDNRCYRQQGTATLFALFLGLLAVDQWYAHHWALAVVKMSCFLISCFCHLSGRPHLATAFGFAGGVWSGTDLVLWIVGGVYGTPNCPGGY